MFTLRSTVEFTESSWREFCKFAEAKLDQEPPGRFEFLPRNRKLLSLKRELDPKVSDPNERQRIFFSYLNWVLSSGKTAELTEEDLPSSLYELLHLVPHLIPVMFLLMFRLREPLKDWRCDAVLVAWVVWTIILGYRSRNTLPLGHVSMKSFLKAFEHYLPFSIRESLQNVGRVPLYRL